MYITKFIKSNWQVEQIEQTGVTITLGEEEDSHKFGEKRKKKDYAYFGRETPEKIGAVDSVQLAKDIEKTLNDFENENIELINIMPVNSGHHEYHYDIGGYGFGYTDGVIIIGKKDDKDPYETF